MPIIKNFTGYMLAWGRENYVPGQKLPERDYIESTCTTLGKALYQQRQAKLKNGEPEFTKIYEIHATDLDIDYCGEMTVFLNKPAQVTVGALVWEYNKAKSNKTPARAKQR